MPGAIAGHVGSSGLLGARFAQSVRHSGSLRLAGYAASVASRLDALSPRGVRRRTLSILNCVIELPSSVYPGEPVRPHLLDARLSAALQNAPSSVGVIYGETARY